MGKTGWRSLERDRSERWTEERCSDAVSLFRNQTRFGARTIVALGAPVKRLGYVSFLMSSRTPSTCLLARSSDSKTPAIMPFLSITYVTRLVFPRRFRTKLVAS